MMSRSTIQPPLAPIQILAALLADGFEGASTRLRAWREVSEARVALLRLTADQLADLGLSEVDALRETSRPFWDLPRRLR